MIFRLANSIYTMARTQLQKTYLGKRVVSVMDDVYRHRTKSEEEPQGK